MRAIDGDALEERFQSLAYDDWNQGVTTSWADAYRECADMVCEQPTIEPERKKGKWNFIGDQMFECTECGACYTQNQFHQMQVRIVDQEFPNFCPNCGADMRQREE